MGLINRIYSRFFPEKFMYGNKETGAGVWKLNEIPDPDYVYIVKYPCGGYLYDGGCAGHVLYELLTSDVMTFKTRQSARNECKTGKIIRIKKSDIPRKLKLHD